MSPKFGTSGLRGLVTELTPALIRAYVQAFSAACPTGGAVHVGRDLRPSSPRIAAEVLASVQAAGLQPIDAGAVPTPALALSSMAAGHAAIMVTGSHIPADRNGLKFYLPGGEISKADEAAILARLDQGFAGLGAPARSLAPQQEAGAGAAYLSRYKNAFGSTALDGLRIGIWQHSSVIRDLMTEVIAALGAEPVPLGRSSDFIPIDTEALAPEARAAIRDWVTKYQLDAVISADGDADRPLLADAAGEILPGDLLGPLTARFLAAELVVTPVSSNSLVEAMGFGQVIRSRIGSPFVIAKMETALAADPKAKVIGYEANGGVLLGFYAQGPAGELAPLMTRDCLLPLLAPLVAARQQGLSVAALAAALPPRFTAADRLTGIAPERAGAFLNRLATDAAARSGFLADCAAELGHSAADPSLAKSGAALPFGVACLPEGPAGPPPALGAEIGLDLTDGLRLRLEGDEILHLRPSGNAPEFRVYSESDSPERAQALLAAGMATVSARLV